MLEALGLIGLGLIGLAGYTWFMVNLTIAVYERRLDRLEDALTDEEIDELERSFRR